MWLDKLLLTAAGIAVATTVLHWLRRGSRRRRQVDAGQVSESWLAEQRGTRSDPFN
jgi:hypothetical protein